MSALRRPQSEQHRRPRRRTNARDSATSPAAPLRWTVYCSALPRLESVTEAESNAGISAPNGNSSSKRPEPPTSLPEASPAGQQFLVQETSGPEPRPPSQEARKPGPRALPTSSRLAAPSSDLAGINVFQLELRQPPPGVNGGVSRPSGLAPPRPSVPPSCASSPALAPPSKTVKKAALTSGPASAAGSDPSPTANLRNSIKATPDGDTDAASVTSFSASLPTRLPPASRLNGPSQPPLQLAATHMTVGSRKPSRQLPLPAANKPNDPKYCYPDPLNGASHLFHQRLAEMAVLEADTVRWERARMFRRKPRFGRQD